MFTGRYDGVVMPALGVVFHIVVNLSLYLGGMASVWLVVMCACVLYSSSMML